MTKQRQFDINDVLSAAEMHWRCHQRMFGSVAEQRLQWLATSTSAIAQMRIAGDPAPDILPAVLPGVVLVPTPELDPFVGGLLPSCYP